MEYSDNADETQQVEADGADEKDEDGWMYTHSSRGDMILHYSIGKADLQCGI